MNSGMKEKIYENTVDCVKKIYQKEGLKGFYQGCLMNLIRSVSNSLLLVLYDEFQKVGRSNKWYKAPRGVDLREEEQIRNA